MVKMYKQSHWNLGASFISIDSEGTDIPLEGVYAQSGARAADGRSDNVMTREDQSQRGIQGKNEGHSVSVSFPSVNS